MGYDLAIQLKDSNPTKQKAQVEFYAEPLPNVKHESDGMTQFKKGSLIFFACFVCYVVENVK